MTDIDRFRDDEDVDDETPVEPEPTLFHGSADEFVRERLRFMYSRRVGGGNASYRWAAHMPILMSPDGPFAKSEDSNKQGDPLPYEAPPEELFPDMRAR